MSDTQTNQENTEAQNQIADEMRRVRKMLKQSSKNELINLVLGIMLQLSDLKNGTKVLLEENKELKNKLEGENYDKDIFTNDSFFNGYCVFCAKYPSSS